MLLATDFREAGGLDSRDNILERGACFDRLELVRIANEYQLAAAFKQGLRVVSPGVV